LTLRRLFVHFVDRGVANAAVNFLIYRVVSKIQKEWLRQAENHRATNLGICTAL
jgi:hypothetical protein